MNELKIPTNLECNSIETISLNEQTNYRLMEIGKINCFLTVFSGTKIFAHVKEEKQLLGLITSVFFFIVLFKFWCC